MMKFSTIFCILGILSPSLTSLNAQVFNVETFNQYKDKNIIWDRNGIEWEESLKKMSKAGLYSIKQDGSAVHEFDYPIEGKTQDEIYDYALDIFRTNYYSIAPNITVLDWDAPNGSYIEKENDILNVSKEQGKITWTFRSPTFWGIWMTVPSAKFSSKSIIEWQIQNGKIHIIETVKYLNININPGKHKKILTPSELHPFGKWSGGIFGLKTSNSIIEMNTNQAILSCYMADQIVLTKIKDAIDKKTKISKISNSHRFYLQPNGDFLTNEGKDFVIEQFEGLNTHDLFNKFRSAITLLYKSSKDNISYVEDDVISINATTQRDFYWKENYSTNIQYVLKFQFRDGRVRIQAPTITSLYNIPITGESTFKETIKLFGLFFNEEPFRIDIIDGLNSIIDDIIQRNIDKVNDISKSNW